jgi:hypothetical protein
MRLNLPVFLFILGLTSLVFPLVIIASGFQLKTIGSLNVDGITISQIWYTNGSNLNFTGIALENADVTANIDGVSATVTADASGNWSYTTSLTDGDHAVSFTSNDSNIAFTLTIGEVATEAGALPSAETPTVGFITPTVIFLCLSALFIFSPLFLRRLI